MTNVAGLNLNGRIWRMSTLGGDDDQGGAVPSGTVIFDPVASRIRSEKPTLALLEQGLETPEIFTGILAYSAYSLTGTFDVRHNDQYEVTHPPISPYYGKRFVIIGVRPAGVNDSRRYLLVTLRRLETANSNELQ